MSRVRVTLVDYGLGNLLSVGRALEAAGATVLLASSAKEIESADRLVLPGVGAFGAGMAGLGAISVVESLKTFAMRERPMLGICLGMQMMLEKSEEFGSYKGLGLIPGSVRKLSNHDSADKILRIPNIGWAKTEICEGSVDSLIWENSRSKFFYFVHSYYADPTDSGDVALTLKFGTRSVPVAVQRGNVYGVQFHPEKSGESGLRFLGSFLES